LKNLYLLGSSHTEPRHAEAKTILTASLDRQGNIASNFDYRPICMNFTTEGIPDN
jgi:hypothetical protein